MLHLPFGLQSINLGLLFLGAHFVVGQNRVDLMIDAATQHNVGTAAGHVGGNRHHSQTTGFQHHLGFALMLLGIQNVVCDAFLRKELGNALGVFNRGGTHQYGLTALLAVFDVLDDGRVLFVFRTEHLVLLIDADHLAIGGNHHRFQTVDVLEFVCFGVGRTGHARELLVHTEVVLERDGSHRLVFLTDFHAFLGFHSLVQTVRPAAAGHQTSREFINDNHFAVLNNVLLVTEKERMRTQRCVQMVHQDDVLRRVQARTIGNQTAFRQDLFDLFVPLFGEVHLMGLFINPIVAFPLFFSLAGEQRRNFVHSLVEVCVVVRGTGNDQRRAGFVNENRVHFVNNRIGQRALTTVGDFVLHVVAQIVKAEFVVGTIGDVGRISRLLRFGVLLRKDGAHGHAEEVV